MPHIVGERIVLREYQYTDLPHIREWVNDPEITDGLSDIFMYPHTQFETESFLNTMVENRSDRQRGFVIAERGSLEYFGQIDLQQIDWKNRNALLGIVIGDKQLHNQGFGQEAIRLLQQFAFQTMNLHRLELEVYAFNEQAYRCYRKCGFKEEGRMREKIFRDGTYWDTIWMSILQREYAILKGEPS